MSWITVIEDAGKAEAPWHRIAEPLESLLLRRTNSGYRPGSEEEGPAQ